MALLLALCGLCSCATAPSRSGLPADVRMNYGAGRGNWLMVMVRLGNGEKLPFVVDTSSPVTIFDRSLVPELGSPVTSMRVSDAQGGHEIPMYYVPPMCLGNTRLQTGVHVITDDCSRFPALDGHVVKGVLGMDVLTNYCIQLDFKKRKIRFLNDTVTEAKWGRPFPLLAVGNGCVFIQANLIGTDDFGSLIDTGCRYGGWLRPELFQQWTNQATLLVNTEVRKPDGLLVGDLYLDLDLRESPVKSEEILTRFNGIGLHTLSHDLVTLDFPRRTLYLKHVNEFPLYTKPVEAEGFNLAMSAYWDMNYLKMGDRLPSWPKDQVVRHTDYYFHHDAIPYCDQVTWNLEKERDPSIYHYKMVRLSPDGAWKLQRAWRSDQNMLLLEEYPLPKGN